MSKKLRDTMPLPAVRALDKLGEDIRDARRRRRISTAIMMQRAMISRMTLHKIERGHPGVALGNYAKVLFALGMEERLAELADVRYDTTGLVLQDERLPQRIRTPRK